MGQPAVPLNLTAAVAARSPNPFNRTGGFTLIEMMVVLTIMAVTMTVLLKASSGQQDQARYSQTVERYNRIKKAIIDVSNVNGVPVVGGFVADMGRLPKNIHELLEAQWCMNNISASQANCDVPHNAPLWGLKTICQDGAPSCSDSQKLQVSLSVGWHGPYLQISQNPSHVDAYSNGSDAFTDGWGNEGYNPEGAGTDPRHNYGWYFNNNASTHPYYNPLCDPSGNAVDAGTCLTLLSYGDGCFKDSALCKGTSAAPDAMDFTYPASPSPQSVGLAYDANSGLAITPDPNQATQYGLTVPAGSQPSLPPPLIKPDDWLVGVGGANGFPSVQVSILPKTCTPTTCSSKIICLNIYHIVDANIVVDSFNGAIIEDGTLARQTVTFSPASGSAVHIPVGNAAISIHDGQCTSNNGTTGGVYPVTNPAIVRYVPVKILPGQQPSFVW